MKINFNQEIFIDGKPVELVKGEKATLGHLCRHALNAPTENKKLSLEEMVQKGSLAIKIGKESEFDLSPEEVVLIRGSLTNVFTHAELVAIIINLLDS